MLAMCQPGSQNKTMFEKMPSRETAAISALALALGAGAALGTIELFKENGHDLLPVATTRPMLQPKVRILNKSNKRILYYRNGRKVIERPGKYGNYTKTQTQFCDGPSKMMTTDFTNDKLTDKYSEESDKCADGKLTYGE